METQKQTALVDKYIRPVVDPSDWTPPSAGEETFSSNQVIGAYQAGMRTMFASIERTIAANEDLAGKHTSKVLDLLRESGFHPTEARLNSSNIEEMEVLVLVPMDEYFDDKFLDVYPMVQSMENGWRNDADGYSISFRFSYDGETLNDLALRADGFIRSHISLLK